MHLPPTTAPLRNKTKRRQGTDRRRGELILLLFMDFVVDKLRTRHVKHHCSVHMQSNVIESSHVILLLQSYYWLSHEFQIDINHEVGEIEIIISISWEIIGGGNDNHNHHRWSLTFCGLYTTRNAVEIVSNWSLSGKVSLLPSTKAFWREYFLGPCASFIIFY